MITSEIIEKMLKNGIYAFGMYIYVRSNGEYVIESYSQAKKESKYIEYFIEDYKIGNINELSNEELENLIKDSFYRAFYEYCNGISENKTKNIIMDKRMKEDRKNKVKDSHFVSIGYLHNRLHQTMEIVDMQRDGNSWYSSSKVPGVEFKENDTFKDVVKEFNKILVSNKR